MRVDIIPGKLNTNVYLYDKLVVIPYFLRRPEKRCSELSGSMYLVAKYSTTNMNIVCLVLLFHRLGVNGTSLYPCGPK